MKHLADTVKTYNGYCAAGIDEEMFKEAQFLRAVDTGSLYVVELDIAAWVTLGGIKTDTAVLWMPTPIPSPVCSYPASTATSGPFPTSRAARPRASAWAPGILLG